MPMSDDDVDVFLGPKNRDYYVYQFRKFESGSKLSWNWPAFFLTAPWLLYRKMWAWSAVYVLGIPLAMIVVIFAIVLVVRDEDTATMLYALIYCIVLFVVAPMFANLAYYRHAQAKVSTVKSRTEERDQQRLELARAGGTSGLGVFIAMIVVAVPLVGILAAIAIPAYQDYTIRAQVSEGLLLANGPKAAVAEFVRENDRYPMSMSDLGPDAPQDITGTYVSSLVLDDGWLVVTYGNNAYESIRDRKLYIGLDEESLPALVWVCGSDDIENKWLPAACRN